MAELQRCAGTQLDRRVVAALLGVLAIAARHAFRAA